MLRKRRFLLTGEYTLNRNIVSNAETVKLMQKLKDGSIMCKPNLKQLIWSQQELCHRRCTIG